MKKKTDNSRPDPAVGPRCRYIEKGTTSEKI